MMTSYQWLMAIVGLILLMNTGMNQEPIITYLAATIISLVVIDMFIEKMWLSRCVQFAGVIVTIATLFIYAWMG